jgi:hypothetical protein
MHLVKSKCDATNLEHTRRIPGGVTGDAGETRAMREIIVWQESLLDTRAWTSKCLEYTNWMRYLPLSVMRWWLFSSLPFARQCLGASVRRSPSIAHVAERTGIIAPTCATHIFNFRLALQLAPSKARSYFCVARPTSRQRSPIGRAINYLRRRMCRSASPRPCHTSFSAHSPNELPAVELLAPPLAPDVCGWGRLWPRGRYLAKAFQMRKHNISATRLSTC